MPIEDTVVVWWESFLITLAETLAVDTEKIGALIGLLIIGLIVARWGRGIIAKPVKWFLGWKRIEGFTKIKPEDIDEKVGWRGLLYHIPNLFRIFILIFIVSVALDLLEFEEASGILGQVFVYFPNIIAVVFLLWLGVGVHYVGTDIIKDTSKVTFLKGERKFPLYGFQVALWGIIISISLTQLGVGNDILPILVGGSATIIAVVIATLRNIIPYWLMVEQVKGDDLKVNGLIRFTMDKEDHEYKILDISATHIKLLEQKSKMTTFISHKNWIDRFYIVNPKTTE